MCPTINLGIKKRVYEVKYNNDIQSIYNSKMWKKLRLWYLKNNPLCERCLKINLIVPAKEIHHKIKISTGKNIDEMLEIALNINNLESLCVACHHKEDNKN